MRRLAERARRGGIPDGETENLAAEAWMRAWSWQDGKGLHLDRSEMEATSTWQLDKLVLTYRRRSRPLESLEAGEIDRGFWPRFPELALDDWFFDRIMKLQPRYRAAFLLGLQTDEIEAIHPQARARLAELIPNLPPGFAGSLPVEDEKIAAWLGVEPGHLQVLRFRARDILKKALTALMEE